MTDPLRGCRAKIRRADECIENLLKEVSLFLTAEQRKISLEKKFSEDFTNLSFIARSSSAVPDRFSVLAGEIIFHLASSLDHLFCALVTRNGENVSRRHYFPIFDDEMRFKNRISKTLPNDVGHEAAKLIESVQPFTTITPRDTILYAVKELNNTDKHRLLVVLCVACALGEYIEIGTHGKEIRDVYGRHVAIVSFFEPGTVALSESSVEIFRIGLSSPAPEFDARVSTKIDLAFERCGLAKFMPITTILPAMRHGVVSTIELFSKQVGSL